MGASLEFGSDSGSRELNKMGTDMARLNFKSSWFIHKLHSFSIQGVLIARQSQETGGRLLLCWNLCFIRTGKFIMSGNYHLLVRVTGDLCFLSADLPHDLKDVPCAAPSSSYPPPLPPTIPNCWQPLICSPPLISRMLYKMESQSMWPLRLAVFHSA